MSDRAAEVFRSLQAKARAEHAVEDSAMRVTDLWMPFLDDPRLARHKTYMMFMELAEDVVSGAIAGGRATRDSTPPSSSHSHVSAPVTVSVCTASLAADTSCLPPAMFIAPILAAGEWRERASSTWLKPRLRSAIQRLRTMTWSNG